MANMDSNKEKQLIINNLCLNPAVYYKGVRKTFGVQSVKAKVSETALTDVTMIYVVMQLFIITIIVGLLTQWE